MSRLVTKEDVTVNFRNYGEIVVPKGTLITNNTAHGIDKNYNFVDEFEWVKRDYPEIDRILIMDAQSYGINIPAEFVERKYKNSNKQQKQIF